MLLGTHSSGKGVDQLMIAEVMLPKVQGEASEKTLLPYTTRTGRVGHFILVHIRIRIPDSGEKANI
jgi:hypothetical protein